MRSVRNSSDSVNSNTDRELHQGPNGAPTSAPHPETTCGTGVGVQGEDRHNPDDEEETERQGPIAADPVTAAVLSGPACPGGEAFPLVVLIGDRQHKIAPGALADDGYRRQCENELTVAQPSPIFDIRHLLDWLTDHCWQVLAFIAGLKCDYTVRSGSDKRLTDLFTAVLEKLPDDSDLPKFERGKQAAIYAAALMHPGSLPAACGRIAKRLKELNVDGYTAGKLLKEARGLAHAGCEVSKEVGVVLVREVLPDAPVPDEAIVPPGWQLNAAGIAKAGTEDVSESISGPMVITRRFTEIDGRVEHLGIAWARDGQWHEEVMPRATISVARSIVELAAFGAPITSNNAAEAVEFLAGFEVANLDIIPRALVTRQMGWQGDDGCAGFLWGDELIGLSTQSSRIDEVQDGSGQSARITFRGADVGDHQLVDGFHAAGTMAGWHDVIRPLGVFTRVRLAVYAALCTSLLAVLRTPNFIVSFAGRSTQGKTTAQRVAASVWGCPDERTPSAAIGTWDSTRVWIERACEVQNDHPLVLDDTKRVRHTQDIAQTLYDVASGRSRGRGSILGIRETGAFRTVLISSGEAQITSFSHDGGTRARVLETWGSPFERVDEGTAEIVNTANDGVLQHYGHAGPAFVRFIIHNRDRWETWRGYHRRFRRLLERRAGNNGVAGRLAAHLATVKMAAILAHWAGLLPWGYEDVVSGLWDELTSESEEADRAAAALRHVLSWAWGRRRDFDGSWTSNMDRPHDGWVGRWDARWDGRADDWQYIAFLPHRIDKILTDGGFEPAPIKRLWFDRGWLRVTGDRKQFKTRVGGMSTWTVAITRQAVEEVQGPDAGDT